MSKPYDAATKDLLELSPADWLTFLGQPAGKSVRLVGAELSTATTQADKVMLVEDVPPWVLHLELQANRDISLPRRLLRYNALLVGRHGWSVSSVVVLLRPAADGAELNGSYGDRHRIDGRESLFPYHIVRLWQVPVTAILAGGVGTLPLAPLAAVTQDDLPAVVRTMNERLAVEVSEETAARLWTATYVLMGLRFSKDLSARILQGVVAMEESVTYQEIVRKGMAQGWLRAWPKA